MKPTTFGMTGAGQAIGIDPSRNKSDSPLQGEVPRELDILHNYLTSLENQVSALAGKLGPLLHLVPESNSASTCSPACGTSIGQQINTAGYRVSGLIDVVASLNDRLAV